jgi:tetratricopeptide (TPR) repeat protein
MIVRSKEFTSDSEKSEAAKKSLEYAKKAVEVDLKDSESWCNNNFNLLDVYGNAYFYLAFFETGQYENLKNSLNCYTIAEKNMMIYKNPDLYYNRGVVHSYLENYKDAYCDFQTANKIDENLKGNDLAENIMNSFIQTVKFVKNQCSIKNKKLNQMLNSIPRNLKDETFTLISISDILDSEGNIIQNYNTKNTLISAKIIQPISKVFEVPL